MVLLKIVGDILKNRDNKNEKIKKDVKKQVCKKLKEISGLDADEIINKYGNSDDYAIDIFKILKNIGITCIPINFLKLEERDESVKKETNDRGVILGVAIAAPDNVTIYYRRDASLNEIRFTLAHELGHCCQTMGITEGVNISFRKDEKVLNKNDKEYLANVFAGKLLIPTVKLYNVYKKLNIKSVAELAKMFVVSENVMKARLKYLNLSYTK